MNAGFRYKEWTLVIGIFVALIIGFTLYSGVHGDGVAANGLTVPQVSTTDLQHLLVKSVYFLR
jgi:hypothetical protein